RVYVRPMGSPAVGHGAAFELGRSVGHPPHSAPTTDRWRTCLNRSKDPPREESVPRASVVPPRRYVATAHKRARTAGPSRNHEVSVQGRVEDVTGATASAEQRTALPVAAERRLSVREQYRRLYRRMALTDVLVTEMALLTAYWVRFGVRMPRADFLWLMA